MKAVLYLHIGAGLVSLVSGYVALFSKKGAAVHTKAGQVFVSAMLVMTAAGLYETLSRSVAVSTNSSASLISAYLVITSLAAVRPVTAASRAVLIGCAVLALGIGMVNARFFMMALDGRAPDNMPFFPFFLFGLAAFLGFAGDVRVMLAGPLRGGARLARHLWRMTFALFIAALSFFIGQSDEFPAAIRIMPLLALPVLVVLVSLFYWLWKVRIRRSLTGIITVTPEPAVS